MKNIYTPPEAIEDVHKIKYKYAIYPLTLVLLTLVVFFLFNIEEIRYVTLICFIIYLAVIYLFRINERVVIDDQNGKSLYSPVNGKIVRIKKEENKTIVIIKKNIFNRSDIRTAGCNDILSYDVQGFFLKNDELDYNYDLKSSYIFLLKHVVAKKEPFSNTGRIIGISPFSLICTLEMPQSIVLKVKIKQKVVSGQTIIGLVDNES